MAKSRVSSLVRVRQGKNYIEFELDEDTGKLVIYIITPGDVTPKVKASLNIEAVNVLRELLGLKKAKLEITEPMKEPKLATELPPDTHRADEHESPDLSGSQSDEAVGMA